MSASVGVLNEALLIPTTARTARPIRVSLFQSMSCVALFPLSSNRGARKRTRYNQSIEVVHQRLRVVQRSITKEGPAQGSTMKKHDIANGTVYPPIKTLARDLWRDFPSSPYRCGADPLEMTRLVFFWGDGNRFEWLGR